MIWWLQCKCGFRLPDNTAAKPICPDCGKRLHVHESEEKK